MQRIAVQSIDKSFAGRKVISGATFYAQRGETVALLGPSGAGKTTIFGIISGLISADSGSIEVDRQDITRLPMYQRARRGIALFSLEASSFEKRTVEDTIRSVLRVVETDQHRQEIELERLLHEFDIVQWRDVPSSILTPPVRRRVEIVRALATTPIYLLLDEPFADIDQSAVHDIQQLIRHLVQRGIGILIADKMNDTARQTLEVSNRAYIICSGEVIGPLRPELA